MNDVFNCAKDHGLQYSTAIDQAYTNLKLNELSGFMNGLN